MNTLYILWFFASCSDAISSLITAGLATRRIKGSYSRFLTMLLCGIALEAVVAAASLLIWWPTEWNDNPEFAIARATARSVKSVGVWLFALYLMGFLGRESPFPAQAKASGEMPTDYWIKEFGKAVRANIKDEYLK